MALSMKEIVALKREARELDIEAQNILLERDAILATIRDAEQDEFDLAAILKRGNADAMPSPPVASSPVDDDADADELDDPTPVLSFADEAAGDAADAAASGERPTAPAF